INSHMPEFVVDKVVRSLNAVKKPVNGSRILVLGVAYKANVNDVRESPALDVITLLQGMGGDVEYHDPYVPVLADHGLSMESVDMTPDRLAGADCVIICTQHREIDFNVVGETAHLVIDTRNAMKGLSANGKVVAL